MVKINPINVAKLLFDDISAKYTKVTPINAKEIELKDQLLGKKCILFIVYKALAAIYGVLQTKNFSLNCLSMAYLNLLNTKSKFFFIISRKSQNLRVFQNISFQNYILMSCN